MNLSTIDVDGDCNGAASFSSTGESSLSTGERVTGDRITGVGGLDGGTDVDRGEYGGISRKLLPTIKLVLLFEL